MTKPPALTWSEHGDQRGAPAVWLGSLGSSAAIWERQLPDLGGLRNIVADLPGHGASGPSRGPLTLELLGDGVLGVLDAAGVARADYVGVSIGAMVGVWLAAHRPERIGRLVAICTAPALDAAAWRDRAAVVRRDGVGAVAEAVVARWLTPRYAAAHPDEVAAFGAIVAGADAESYAGCCDAIAAMDLRPDLAQIATPTLVIAAADDPATPPEHGRAIAEGIAGAELVVVPGAHAAPWESPAIVNALLAGFLAAPSAARHAAGMAVRRAVLGDDHVDRAVAATSALDAAFQRFLTESAWGTVWTDETLDRRTRSCLTIALLTALRAEHELPLHVSAALRNGLTPAEIAAVIHHTAVYAGTPAANTAMQIAKRVLAE